MDLKTLQDDMKAAMKSGDANALSTLRMLISEVKKRQIDSRTTLDEAGIQKLVGSMLKQRQDSIDAFTKGNRPDLADKEKAEMEILKKYLPAQMSRAEIEAVIDEAIRESGASGPNDIGKVMKVAVAKTSGKADGRLVNEIARAKLATS